MNFIIKPASTGGIHVKVDFYVDTWDDLATLMRHLARTSELLDCADEV